MQPRDTTLTALELTTPRAVEADVPLQMDEETFRGFYDRTSRPVWAYLHRLTGNPHTADDLLQETYYRFLKAPGPLDGESHRRHYLFRIATNLANDRFRRAKTRPIETAADLDATSGTPVASPDQQLHVAQAMARLSRRERSMIWLAYAHGSSHEEIAQTMGLRVGSVKTLLFRARRRLAGLLGRTEGVR
jgi:RNA polymerase sigma-70 factor, ECF subfamily